VTPVFENPQALAYSMACIYFGGCVKGLTGFGLSMISVPLLVLIAPPSAVVPVFLLLNTVMNVMLVYGLRNAITGRIWPLVISGIAGVPVGTYILVVVDGNVLRLIIGLVILVFAVALLTGYRRQIGMERLGFGLVGAVSGVLGGSISISGPPVVLFLSNLAVDKSTFRANLVAYFLCLNLFSIPVYYAGGLLTGPVFRTFLWLVPALILGCMTGTVVARKVSEQVFRQIALIIVIVAATLAIISSIRSFPNII